MEVLKQALNYKMSFKRSENDISELAVVVAVKPQKTAEAERRKQLFGKFAFGHTGHSKSSKAKNEAATAAVIPLPSTVSIPAKGQTTDNDKRGGNPSSLPRSHTINAGLASANTFKTNTSTLADPAAMVADDESGIMTSVSTGALQQFNHRRQASSDSHHSNLSASAENEQRRVSELSSMESGTAPRSEADSPTSGAATSVNVGKFRSLLSFSRTNRIPSRGNRDVVAPAIEEATAELETVRARKFSVDVAREHRATMVSETRQVESPPVKAATTVMVASSANVDNKLPSAPTITVPIAVKPTVVTTTLIRPPAPTESGPLPPAFSGSNNTKPVAGTASSFANTGVTPSTSFNLPRLSAPPVAGGNIMRPTSSISRSTSSLQRIDSATTPCTDGGTSTTRSHAVSTNPVSSNGIAMDTTLPSTSSGVPVRNTQATPRRVYEDIV